MTVSDTSNEFCGAVMQGRKQGTSSGTAHVPAVAFVQIALTKSL